jgi:uncharacterized peroxidase-related enzyme
MTGLPFIDPNHTTGPAAELLAAVQKALGVTPNMTKAMANSPAVLKGYLELSGALAGGALSAAVREQIALHVAELNGCDYCLSAHTYVGTHLAGLDETEAAAARRGKASDSKAAAALSLAGAVVRTRGSVGESDLAAARAAGLDDTEIAEVLGHVALNVFTNYCNKAAAVDIDWPVVHHAAA